MPDWIPEGSDEEDEVPWDADRDLPLDEEYDD
jgi:hypothetical protein